MNIGFSQRRAALTMWAWTASLGAAALATRFIPFREGGEWHVWETLAVAAIALGALAFSVYIVYLLEIVKLANPRVRRRRAETEETERLQRVSDAPRRHGHLRLHRHRGLDALLKRLGDRYAEALAEHRRIVREAFGSRGGREIDTQGDAFFYSFERARDAVAAAVAAQRALASHGWPDGEQLRVRMSIHTGEPVVGEEGYVGIDVHRAARICSAGHGGQVLLSATTAALVSGALPTESRRSRSATFG